MARCFKPWTSALARRRKDEHLELQGKMPQSVSRTLANQRPRLSSTGALKAVNHLGELAVGLLQLPLNVQKLLLQALGLLLYTCGNLCECSLPRLLCYDLYGTLEFGAHQVMSGCGRQLIPQPEHFILTAGGRRANTVVTPLCLLLPLRSVFCSVKAPSASLHLRAIAFTSTSQRSAGASP